MAINHFTARELPPKAGVLWPQRVWKRRRSRSSMLLTTKTGRVRIGSHFERGFTFRKEAICRRSLAGQFSQF